MIVCATMVSVAHAEVSATQPTTRLADSPQVQAVREQLLAWDRDYPKMSLEECRKTYYTQSDREAVYCDWEAHESWEANKTEQAVRDKWGPEADAKFAHIIGYTSREDDAVCHIQVEGDHAIISWDMKDMTPEKLVRVDGHWLIDMHSLFADRLKDDPNTETNRYSTGKMMARARQEIDSGKFDDADSFIADFKNKWDNPPPGN
jgi:hypothetical protein